MNKRVTVIIFSSNSLERLSKSVESVIKQTYCNIETFVICPTITDENLKNYLEKHKIIHLETDNSEPKSIINKALSTSNGDFIAFLNEGDIFSPRKIEIQMNAFDDSPGIGLIFTAYQVMCEDGNVQNTIYLPEFKHHSAIFILLHGHILSISTAMFRKEPYQSVKQCSDDPATELDLWIRIAKGCKIGIINMPLIRRTTPIGGNIQPIVLNVLNSISPEDLLPGITLRSESLSTFWAHIIKGVILMRYRLHKSAMENFVQALQLCSDSSPSLIYSLPLTWLGMLKLQVKIYNTALNYLEKVPKDDMLYLDAQWMSTLARQAQNASDKMLERIDIEVSKQYGKLLDTTLDLVDGIKTETPDIAEEISQYLNWDISQVFEALFYGGVMVADEWNQKLPQTPDKISDFYKQTGSYIFDLAGWHRGDPARRKLTETAISICKQNNVQKVLDFGCGIGQDGISFSGEGFAVTLADLPGKTLDFAKWRIERRNLNIKIVNADGLSGMCDAILCFDVLEHLWEPEETVRYLYNHLSDNGILLVTASFGYDEVHPSHLERNARYSGDEFTKMMERVGFLMEKRYRTPLAFRKI